MMEGLAAYLVRNARGVFILTLAFLALSTLWIRPLQVNGDLEGFYIPDNPYAANEKALATFFPKAQPVQIQVSPTEGSLDEFLRGQSLLDSSLMAEFRDSDIRSLGRARPLLLSVFEPDQAIDQVLDSLRQLPLLRQLISENGKHTLTILFVNDSLDLDQLSKVLARPYPGIQRIFAISQFHVEAQLRHSILTDTRLISGLVLLAASFIILLAFRDVRALLLVLTHFILSLVPLLVMFSLLKAELTMLTMMSVSLILIFSICDSIHLINAWYKSLDILHPSHRIQSIFSRLGVPSFFTSFTTAVAFFSFLSNRSEYIAEFGLISGVAVMAEFFITIFTFPYLMRFLKEKPSDRPLLTRLSNLVVHRRKAIGIGLLGLLALSFFFVGRMQFRTNFDSFFPKNTEIHRHHEEFSSNFQSLMGMDVLLERKTTTGGPGLKQISLDLDRAFSRIPGVRKVYSFRDQLGFQKTFLSGIGPLSNRSVGTDFISGKKARIHLALANPWDSKRIEKEVKHLTAPYSATHTVRISSQALLFSYIDEQVAKSLLWSFLSSAFILFVIFVYLNRGLRNALVSMLANLVPIGGLILLMAATGLDLNIGTAMTAVICLGIIVDDTIHIVYRRIRLGKDLNELNQSLFLSSFLLAVTFLLFMVSGFEPTRNFGLLSGVVFILAWLCDMVLLSWLLKSPSAK